MISATMIKNKRKIRSMQTSSLDELIPAWLQSKGLSPKNAQIIQLWRNWPMVMGRFLSPVAKPLGCRGKTLIVGAEDNLILQDLNMCSKEILERTNAFMGEDCFERVEFRLCLNKTPLNLVKIPELENLPPPNLPPRPDKAGFFLDPNSPIGLCHQAYLRLFNQDISK